MYFVFVEVSNGSGNYVYASILDINHPVSPAGKYEALVHVHGFAEPVPIAINPVQHAEDKLCKPDAELWHTKPVLGSSVLAPIDASV